MDEDDFRALIQNDDLADGRSVRWGPLLLVALLVAVIGVWLVLVVGSEETDPEVAPEVSSSTAVSTTTTSTIAPLVGFEPDPPIMYYPRLLPEGMEVCSAQLGLPVTGDELCDPDDEFRWVKVAISQVGPPGGISVTDRPGITVLRESPPEVGITIGEGGYRLWAEGVPLEQLIDIAGSLPIASSEVFNPADEPEIGSLDESVLAELLGHQLSQLDFRGSAGSGWEVYGPGLTLYTVGRVEGMGEDIREIAMRLAKTQMVSPEHSLIVGREPQGTGAVAFWLQRDRFWRLDSQFTVEQLVDLVESMEQAIDQLP